MGHYQIARAALAATLLAASLGASAGLTLLPGSSPQTGKVGSPLASVISVRVTDDQGRAVAGARVRYVEPNRLTTSDDPACGRDFFDHFYCLTTTNADGFAQLPRLKGAWSGTWQASVVAYSGEDPLSLANRYGSAPIDLIIDIGQAPAVITITSGNDQRAVIGTKLQPISIRLAGPNGPLPNKRISPWRTRTSTGFAGVYNRDGFDMSQVHSSWIMTGPDGAVELPPYWAGWGVGAQTVRLSYSDTDAGTDVYATINFVVTNTDDVPYLSLADLWWGGPTRSGWGVSIAQRREQLFSVYFVYDDAGRPTWFTHPNPTWGPTGLGDQLFGRLYTTRGTPWYEYDASKTVVTMEENGWGAFTGPEVAMINTTINFANGRRNVWHKLQRTGFVHEGPPSPIQGVSDLWWGGPSQSGWGVGIHEGENGLFLIWYTYDAEGRPVWYSMPTGAWTDASTYKGTIYQTFAAPYSMAGYNPDDGYKPVGIVVNTVGTFELKFDGTQRATFEVWLENRNRTFALERFEF